MLKYICRDINSISETLLYLKENAKYFLWKLEIPYNDDYSFIVIHHLKTIRKGGPCYFDLYVYSKEKYEYDISHDTVCAWPGCINLFEHGFPNQVKDTIEQYSNLDKIKSLFEKGVQYAG